MARNALADFEETRAAQDGARVQETERRGELGQDQRPGSDGPRAAHCGRVDYGPWLLLLLRSGAGPPSRFELGLGCLLYGLVGAQEEMVTGQ